MPALVDLGGIEGTDADLSWLRKPWKRRWRHVVAGGEVLIDVVDQPGRWMSDAQLTRLQDELSEVAEISLDERLAYGVFSRTRSAFRNRVIAVAYAAQTGRPCAFTAMVYLPLVRGRKTETIIHLGLTMIAPSSRGQRLQTPLFQRIFLSPIVNQFRTSFVVTNIAASPAGIGAVSDYFLDTYPSYHEDRSPTPFHHEVAAQVLARHRHEFGCSRGATFDPDSFVVAGSNQESGGGASAFIKSDPVSRYRDPACNEFCERLLDFERGDELFQVGRADLIRGLWASRKRRRGISRRLALPRAAALPARLTASTSARTPGSVPALAAPGSAGPRPEGSPHIATESRTA